jgi:PAS domain S-box-containing protein
MKEIVLVPQKTETILMRKNTRDSGIDIIGEVPWGTHFCQFYQTKEDLMDILIPYFKAGLENNEFCIWITSPPLEVEEAKEALRKSVPDYDIYQKRGQIEIIPHSHWYVKEDTFDSEKAMNRWFEKLDRALTNGYNGLRLTEDASWIKKNWTDFTGFEEKLDNTLENTQIMALYTYSLDRCSSAEIINVALNHQFTLIKEKGEWEKVESSNRQNINNRELTEEAPHQNKQHARVKLNGIISPNREMADLELSDIVDSQAIQSLMNDFYNFAHIAMALVDLKGNILVSVGWQDICTRFHRVHPETCKHCIESDTKLSSGIPPGEFKLYRCRNNMWDIATPVIASGQHVGNIFSGQFFFEDELLDYELFRSQARKYGFNEEEYIAALEKVPRLSLTVVNTCMAFFMTLANMLSQLSYSNFKLTQLLKERDVLVEALRGSEERYRSLYENSLDGILLTKPDGNILCANPQACKMFGMTEDEIVQAGREGTVINDEKLAAALEERRLTGRMRAELIHRRKDGSTFVCDTTSKLFVDADGSINTSLIIRDISERKRVEEALQKSEMELARAQQIAQIGSWTWDLITNEVTWSEQSYRNYGLAPGEVKPSYELFLSFIVPEDREMVYREVQKAIDSGHKYNITYNIIRIDGTPRILSSENKIVMDESGKVVLMYGTNQDITERKKAEEALKKAHDNLEKLVEERTAELEKAYNSLKESETGLAEAQKMAHIGSWEWDIAADKAYWSEEMYRIFGRDPQKPAPSLEEYLERVHPDDLDYYCKVNDYKTNVRTSGLDFRIILANGEERTLHIKSDFIYNDENIPIRVKGIVQDITERKKTEEKIQILANAVESSNDAIVTLSLEGMITSWNKAAEQVYGYLAEEIIGKDVSILEPDNIKGEIKQFSEKIKQGKKVQHYETSRLRKDGTIINISVTLSPIFDITGRLVAISGIVRDVTERIRAEEALRESEARMRLFYESDMLGVCYYYLDGSITDANDKFLEIVGYTREDLQAGEVNWKKMTPPEYRPLDEQIIAELKTIGLKEPKEKEYIRKDGSHVPVIVGAATLDKVDNGGTAFVLDITEKKKAEEALANIETTRKKEIHHRIKNNLQVISSLLDLQADKFDNPRVIEAFRESQDRVKSMALIHEELYKGRETDTLDFCEYIQELAESLFQTYILNSKNIHMKMDLEENAFFNMDVAVPLGIIVNEIVSNSLKHAFPDRNRGEIRIELRRDKNGGHKKKDNKFTSFILTVSDDGIGISENLSIQDLESLGIQLITTLVDQIDGKLELKRNNGTEFTIRFTVAEEKNRISAPALQQ